MRSVVMAVLLGVALGGGLTWLAIDRGWLPDPARPSAVRAGEGIPRMSLAAAESHRAARFEQLRTVAEVLALPGDFAKAEALYAMAGRADAAGVQDLIFQADGIADGSQRSRALAILFSRLAELDTASALALCTSEYFAHEPAIEAAVWASWARLDLDAALQRAATLDDPARRRLAAEAMLAAHGFWGNAGTARIADTLDFTPDVETRVPYLYRLADREPAAAIAYVNELPDHAQQQELAQLLGRYLGRRGAQADRYDVLFDDESLRRSYGAAVAREAVMLDPEAVLDELLSAPSRPIHDSRVHQAMQALAEQDIERALSYLARVENRRDLATLAKAVAGRLAGTDPERALAWARENDYGGDGEVYRQVLLTIAADSPQLAMQQAQSISDPVHRQQATMMIAMTVSHRDPERAIALVEQLPVARDRNQITEMLASNWMQADPDAALDWLLKSDLGDNDSVMVTAANNLAQADVDSAMRWLPRIDERHQATWRAAIAANLALQESPAVAEGFIARFQHSPDYPQLVASVAAGLARTDIEAAFRMGERISSESARDSLYLQLVGQQAQASPQQAAGRLSLISDPANRSAAATQIAVAWAARDAAAAEDWARNLARDRDRDHAIVGLMWSWEELTPSRRALIDSIGDSKVREQGLTNFMWRVASSDMRRAQSLLDELDLTDDERQAMESRMEMLRNRRLNVRF